MIAQRKKMEQLERARQFEEQRKAHAKRARKEAAELSGEGISNDIHSIQPPPPLNPPP